jgi:uncharacterized protein (DUF1684 family)
MSMTLLDWRRRVAAMYGDVRASAERDPEGTLERFRAQRDLLFRDHPQTPLAAADRAGFAGIPYWPHDPGMRFEAEVELAEPVGSGLAVGSSPAVASPAIAPVIATSVTGEDFRLTRIGRVRLPVGDLEVYWIDAYGGGVFIPFRDATSGTETYGAGRYLLDTVKGADLGGSGDRLILDFNYAYHPSCAYDSRWSCPLAPPANRLAAPVRAGERL